MKILFYADTVFGFGGVQRVLAVIAKALSEKYYITILSTDTAEDLSMYEYSKSKVHFEYISYNERKDIEYYVCKSISYIYKKVLPQNGTTAKLYSYSFFRPSYKRSLTTKINKGNYDVVIGVHAFLSLHLASVRHNLNAKKVIGWMHNSYEALFEKKNPYLPGLKSFFANEMKLLDDIVVLSKSDANIFKERLGLECTTIYNPLTLEPHGRASLAYKKFLAVGRFAPRHKGFDLLIKAFAKFTEKNEDWTLEIVGEGEEESLYRSMIKEYNMEDRIKLFPFTKDIQKHYAEASVYVLSSRWEGFGLVLVEAMSHGLPIISSDLPVAKELLEGKECATFFKCGDIGEMAQVLTNYANTTDWDNLSANAYNTAKSFSISNIIELWLQLIKEC